VRYCSYSMSPRKLSTRWARAQDAAGTVLGACSWIRSATASTPAPIPEADEGGEDALAFGRKVCGIRQVHADQDTGGNGRVVDRSGRLTAGAQEATHQPVLIGQRAGRGARRSWASSRGVRWKSPRSTRLAGTGGPWGSRRPVPPICSAANSRPPPSSFAQAPTGGVEPGADESRSYAEWLSQRPGVR
jgi:hypothetical protein